MRETFVAMAELSGDEPDGNGASMTFTCWQDKRVTATWTTAEEQGSLAGVVTIFVSGEQVEAFPVSTTYLRGKDERAIGMIADVAMYDYVREE